MKETIIKHCRFDLVKFAIIVDIGGMYDIVSTVRSLRRTVPVVRVQNVHANVTVATEHIAVVGATVTEGSQVLITVLDTICKFEILQVIFKKMSIEF